MEDSLERNLTNQISKSLQAPLQTEMKKFHLVQQNSQLQVNQLLGQMRQLLVSTIVPWTANGPVRGPDGFGPVRDPNNTVISR